VLKGLIADWPAVNGGIDGVRQFAASTPVTAMVGEPAIKGRFFYNQSMDDFNFQRKRVPLPEVLNQIERFKDVPNPPAFYVGSTSVAQCLPGFSAENNLPLSQLLPLSQQPPLVSAWMGNQSRIAAHYDVPDNIACVVSGKRRFTLFPPTQISNLYVGPIDFTPAGQAISLVDFDQPDLERFPQFTTALKYAQIAELEAGDGLFIPSMWWHHVEALDSFNLLINYWWRQSPAYMGAPMDALRHSLLSIRDLPDEQRQAWAEIFDHYIFNPDENILPPLDEMAARKLRALLINKLNR